MSTSTSTTSGMTLVFTPPWHMLGEKVVCVDDHANFATPAGSRAIASSTRAGSVREALSAGSRSSEPTKPAHSSLT